MMQDITVFGTASLYLSFMSIYLYRWIELWRHYEHCLWMHCIWYFWEKYIVATCTW